MNNKASGFNNVVIARIVFALSVITSVFWVLGNYVNVYRFKLSGAIFELLWLPMLAMVFFLPLFSLILWFRQKFRFMSIYLYAFLLGVATLLFMFLKN